MVVQWVASAVASLGARKAGGTCGPLTIRTSVAGSLLSHSDAVSAEPVEQAVERFVGLDCRNLGSGRLASHCVPHPPLEPRPTGMLAPANSRERGRHRSRPILSRRLPQKDAVDAHAKMRCPADGERLDVEGASWSQAESSATNTSASRRISQPSANPPPETMMMGIGEIATSPTSR